MKKVLLITVRSDFGGGPRHVNQLIEKLPTKIELYLACPQSGEPYSEQWHNCNRIHGYYCIPHRKFSINRFVGLICYIRTHKISIVHSHGNGAGVYSRLIKLFFPSVKIVHTFHGITSDYHSYWKKNANKMVCRFLKYWTDRFICVSKGEFRKAELLGFAELEKTSVIYNGVEKSKHSYQRESDTFNIITLSRFDYQKNMDLAFEVAAKLRSYSNIEFVWVGDGEDCDRLASKSKVCGCHIKFMGFSNNVLEYLESSHLYLSTSRFEGLPYALVEACEAGLPIVASDVVGNNEVCIGNRNGILFKTSDEAVDAILRIYNDEKLYKRFSEQSKQVYDDFFTIETMVKRVVEVYDSL